VKSCGVFIDFRDHRPARIAYASLKFQCISRVIIVIASRRDLTSRLQGLYSDANLKRSDKSGIVEHEARTCKVQLTCEVPSSEGKQIMRSH
jgi:hypothetical protein